MLPETLGGDHPAISMPASDSNVAFGAFRTDGTGFRESEPRILAHEPCGHGRLGRTGGTRGCRPPHDATIDTDNEIAGEHGGVRRGKYADKRQDESFLNPAADRSKVLFEPCDGLHFEDPGKAPP